MTTSFGPQSPNYTTTRPPTATQVSSGLDTWFADCSSAAAEDGTAITASFFNILIGNLRNAVRSAGIALDDTDAMLWQAMQAAAAQVIATSVPNYSGNAGVQVASGVVRLAIGQGTQTLFTA